MKHKISVSYIVEDPEEWFWEAYKNGDINGMMEYVQFKNPREFRVERA